MYATRLTQEKQEHIEAAKAAATARIKGRYAEHSAQKDAKKLIVSDVALRPTRGRHRTAPRVPATRGQAMMARARNGTAMQTRRMMLIPPRAPSRGFVRAAPSVRAPRTGAPPDAPDAPPSAPRPAPLPPSPVRAKRPPPEGQSIFMPKRRIPSQPHHSHV